MKELLKDEFQDSQIQIVEEKQQRKEIKLIGQQRKIPGLTLWEFDRNTKEIKKAEYKKQDVILRTLKVASDDTVKSNKVVVNENCFYIQALNKKNAIKHLKRYGMLNIF